MSKTCERCGECRRVKPGEEGRTLLDYCSECSTDLCAGCMAKGCCGYIPAKSGEARDFGSDDSILADDAGEDPPWRD